MKCLIPGIFVFDPFELLCNTSHLGSICSRAYSKLVVELRPEDTLSVSCQILIPSRSVNSMHMLNREGQESPCIKEASDVESQKLLILNGII